MVNVITKQLFLIKLPGFILGTLSFLKLDNFIIEILKIKNKIVFFNAQFNNTIGGTP